MADDRKLDSMTQNRLKSFGPENGIDLLNSGLDRSQDSTEIVYSERSSSPAARRRINPAIYVESMELHSHSIHPFQYHNHLFESLNKTQLPVGIHDDIEVDIPFYYHSCSNNRSKFSTLSTNQSKSWTQVEHRCRINANERCVVNGHKVVHGTKSLPNSILSSCQSRKSTVDDDIRAERKKSQNFQQHKVTESETKDDEIGRLKCKKFNEERTRQEQKNFLLWVERKKQENINKRMLVEKQLELERRLKDIEAKAMVAKEIYFQQWKRRKDMAQRAGIEEKQLIMKKLENEQKMRLNESSKAFALWREKSKNRPKPATQGLLPHQQARPAYINPIPWIVDDDMSTPFNGKS